MPREKIAGLAPSKFHALVNKVAKEMDADSDYHETVAIAKDLGATAEQAHTIAYELGRRY
jgi:hypothetical protein